MYMHMWRSKVNLRCCALGLVHLGFCDRVSHWELDLPDWACLAVQGTWLSFHFCYPSSGIIIVPPHRGFFFYLVARNRTQVGHHDYMEVTLLRSLSSYLSPLSFPSFASLCWRLNPGHNAGWTILPVSSPAVYLLLVPFMSQKVTHKSHKFGTYGWRRSSRSQLSGNKSPDTTLNTGIF